MSKKSKLENRLDNKLDSISEKKSTSYKVHKIGSILNLIAGSGFLLAGIMNINIDIYRSILDYAAAGFFYSIAVSEYMVFVKR